MEKNDSNINGKWLFGEFVLYDSNGNIYFKFFYKNDKLNGEYK